MKRSVFDRFRSSWRQALWGGGLVGLLLAGWASAIGDLSSEGKRQAEAIRRRNFSLFAGPTVVLEANLVQCGLRDDGDICSNVFNSPTGGGGFWPAGSIDQYIFNTGLQLAGRLPEDVGFAWAGDTVAYYSFDASGPQKHSTPLTSIFKSTDPDDAANWPDAALVTDADLFQDILLGRIAASQEDSWVQYWDGDPALNARRKHPMGIRVTQRSLAWNFPLGNESVIYFLFDFENATNDPDFQRLNELQFFGGENAIPDAGYRIDSIFASFSTDMDVTDAFDQNLSSAVLPFSLGISYNGRFVAPEFVFPPSLFKAPFFTNAPGLVGVKYLRSPIDPATGEEVGLTMFSNTQNPSQPGAVFFDPQGDDQLFRYLSGGVTPALGDTPCNIVPTTPLERPLCFILQGPSDTRFFQASGPFSLDAGQKGTIVVAYIMAATVATLPDGSPSGIIQTNDATQNAPGIPSFHPGFGSWRGCDVNGQNCSVVRTAAENDVLPLERGAGWVAYTGPPPASPLELTENRLDEFQVQVVPESLLGKALVAQTIFNNKFLLGFAPDPPPFFLVPGNNSVTVIWERSATETIGDPFAQVASDPTSALFNPNYRGAPDNPNEAQQNDVEGYRIFRGTTPANVQQIAQFDFAETSFLDFTCETVLPGESVADLTGGEEVKTVNQAGDTVEVTGFAAGDICPLSPGGDFIERDITALVFNNGGDGGPPGGGVVRLQNLDAAGLSLDTAAAGAGPPLTNTDVPFVFVDNTVQNNFTFFYEVRAFDVNSQASGPTSLESGSFSLSTVPRQDEHNLQFADFQSSLSGDDGVPLNPDGPFPSLDSETGIFSSGMPPTDGLSLAFAPLVERLLPAFSVTATIDSIVLLASGNLASGTQEFPPSSTCTVIPGTGGRLGSPFGSCWKMFVTVDKDGQVSQEVVPGYNPWWSAFGEPGTVEDLPLLAAEVPFDAAALKTFGIPSGSGNATVLGTTSEGLNNSAASGPQARRFGNFHGGPRWFDGDPRDGDNNTIADPSKFRRAGHVAAADTIFFPQSHSPADASLTEDAQSNSISFEKQCFNRAIAFLDRAADVVWTWGGGTFSEVRDVTHNVDVPFSPKAGPTWGFLTTDANGNGVIDWHDFNYIDRALQILRQVDGGDCNLANGTRFDPNLTATPVDLVSTPSLVPTSTAGMDLVIDLEAGAALPQTGVGFGLFAYGQRFIFEMSQLPADGTKWTLRTYKGNISVSNELSDDPSGYSFSTDVAGGGGPRPVLIPGLKFNFVAAQGTEVIPSRDLTLIHTVPDPYLATSPFDLAPTEKSMMFVNLPPRAEVRIYSLTGILVRALSHNDPTGGGRMAWDMRNRNNQFVASGVYFYHVSTPDGDEMVGKFTVVNFAGSN